MAADTPRESDPKRDQEEPRTEAVAFHILLRNDIASLLLCPIGHTDLP